MIRRRYEALTEDVWDACTDPRRLNRWFLQVTGELRAGGTFQLAGNARGEIVRCEPPRLLTLSWVYGDRPVDEVELRLSPGDDGDTVLEIEHATVSALVEWDGRQLDVIPGIGAGSEVPLGYLATFLRGALPDAPSAEWYEPNAEDAALAERCSEEWSALARDAER